jgi:preprotein translocase subunit YajC
VTALKKGDKVITTGGIIGTVASIEDTEVLLEVDKDVKIRLMKTAIGDVNPGK